MDVRPLTQDRFGDLEALFAGKGCSFARSCWCMEYRLSGKRDLPDGVPPKEARKAMLHDLAGQAPAPGLIAYQDGAPVGWVTLGPRESFRRLARSPVMKPVDDVPVWSVVCFVVPSDRRGQGIAHDLLSAAVTFARSHGAEAVEGYPVDKAERSQPQWLWHGTRSMFERAGFAEIARRTPQRPVMRRVL
ncbi:N-acetyltransferase family protein [Aestuariibius sp. 2305UL40-4]|uniref:GNAT family N-acetyltransferase n=1 Tax=Aestuariibius violaceus TaxID=3234132 RepID=UPI00345E24A1